MTPALRFGLIIAGVCIFVDQLSKWWILTSVMNPPSVIPVTSFFNLVLTWNRGISFGMFSNDGNTGAWVLSILALVIIAFLISWMRKADTRAVTIALGLIIGGALGNVIDRILHTAVVDFLDFHFNNFHWPAFNAADSFITVGAAILIFDSLFSRSKTRPTMADDEN